LNASRAVFIMFESMGIRETTFWIEQLAPLQVSRRAAMRCAHPLQVTGRARMAYGHPIREPTSMKTAIKNSRIVDAYS